MKKTTYILVFLIANVYSQNMLTKEQALQSLLENNYSVKLSKNNIAIAENNSSILNSGYLPRISAAAGANYSNTNQDFTFKSGDTSAVDNAESDSYNASINLNYTLFNGFNRKYFNKQLQEQLSISELAANATIDQAIFDVFSMYYQTAEITENLNILKEALLISKKRLERTNYQYEYGQTNKLAVLNAQVDINNDSINYINTRQVLENSKRNLLLLIGDKEVKDFNVDTSVSFKSIDNLENLLQKLAQNTTMQQAEKSIILANYNTKLNKSSFLPSLGLNSAYGWNQNNNPKTSEISTQINNGLSAGLSLSWNIFDGGATKTRVQNALINEDNQQLIKDQLEHQLKNAITNTFYDYQNKRYILQTQEQNLLTAETNFSRTEEQYKLGRVSSIEYRQAQLNLLNAQTAILSAKYDAKIVELSLLQLTGELNKEFI